MIGNVLNERYKLKRELGKGGMAIVYEAEDLLLGRSVAIKMLRSEYASEDDFTKKFRHEAKAVAKISHPNVVSIFDIGEDDELPFLVMENIKGENLKDLIEKRGTLSITEALDIARQICSALVVAHENNIIHCDIKPHNILINLDKQVKVTDFGIAKAVSDSTLNMTDTIMGSAHYFSPEQAKGEEIEIHSDIYSVGVVLYEMLTGEVPFEGKTPISVALKHIEEEAKPPTTLKANIPEEVNNLILKAISKNPEKRFDSAVRMKEEITKVIKSLNSASSQPSSSKSVLNDNGTTKVMNKEDILKDKKKLDNKSNNDNINNSSKERNRKILSKLTGIFNLNWLIWLGIVFGLILIIIIGISYYYRIYTDPPIVEVPEVIGFNYEQAQNRTRQVGLSIEVQNEVFNSEYEEDLIISQYPSANNMIRQTRPVRVTISKGPSVVQMPDLENKTLREARVVLQNENIEIDEIKEEFNNEIPDNNIIDQDPAYDTEIAANEKVTLVVSKGPQPEMIEIPDLIGLNEEEAISKLEEFNLGPGDIEKQETKRYKAGIVAEHEYLSEEEVPEETRIDLKVSDGLKNPDNLQTHSRIVSLPIDGFNRQKVRIIVIDENGRDEFYDKYHQPGENVSVEINSVGATTYEIYLNGNLIYEASYDEEGNIVSEQNHY